MGIFVGLAGRGSDAVEMWPLQWVPHGIPAHTLRNFLRQSGGETEP